MKLAWGARVAPDFRNRVIEIAATLGIDPSWLMACIAFESGRTFSPSARNALSGATGLIQFMPSTARGLNTTVEDLAAMTAEDQLLYVARYFKPYVGRLHSLSDTYMAILWPKAIGLAENAVIFPAGSREFLANRGLDIDHDGEVTKAEAAQFVVRALEEGNLPGNIFDYGDSLDPVFNPTTPAEPQPEEPAMAPLLLLPILSALIEQLPVLAKAFGPKAEKATERVTAATTAVEAVVKAVGAINGEDAVQKIAADPTLRQVATAALVADPVVGMYLTEVGGGIEAARGQVVAGNPAMIQILGRVTYVALGFLAFANVAGFMLAGVLIWKDKAGWEQIVSTIIQADIAAAFGAIGFWLGSSLSKNGAPSAQIRQPTA